MQSLHPNKAEFCTEKDRKAHQKKIEKKNLVSIRSLPLLSTPYEHRSRTMAAMKKAVMKAAAMKKAGGAMKKAPLMKKAAAMKKAAKLATLFKRPSKDGATGRATCYTLK